MIYLKSSLSCAIYINNLHLCMLLVCNIYLHFTVIFVKYITYYLFQIQPASHKVYVSFCLSIEQKIHLSLKLPDLISFFSCSFDGEIKRNSVATTRQRRSVDINANRSACTRFRIIRFAMLQHVKILTQPIGKQRR